MRRTILIVDDSEVDRMMLSGIMSEEYNTLEASSGEEAISLVHRKFKTLSAIILDIVMKGMNGYEVLKAIRQNALFHSIPIIIMTSLDDEQSHERAIACGANGFVTKPFSHALLLHTVQNAIMLRETAAILNHFRRDKLTGLLSRESFCAEAERLISRHGAGYYVLSCIDVENFKVINDQYGTHTGDEVLRHIANSIKQSVVGVTGLACRFWSDNFATLYPVELLHSGGIDYLHAELMSPPCLDRRVRIRIGRYIVDDLSLSVSAMYDRATLAEKSIKGTYDVLVAKYSDSMRLYLLSEQQIVNDMGRALAEGEFEPWFQPQYNHATGALIGAEALVRWKKDGEFIPLAKFIPIFEQNGFIYEMDQCVWEQVCALMRKWVDEGRNPLPVSINISRRDLFHKNFISVLTGIIDKYALPYSLIRLEVTESAFSESSGQIIAKVNELIELGFTVEIDDFGSGYSSFNSLKDVPASILKLDMRFLENTRNQQRGGNIIASIVRMARWLGMAVIAEGVEIKEQADYLKSIGCYYIQGYYYAKPMPVDAYEKLLDAASKKESKLTRLQTLATLDNNEFWNPGSMDTLIFNSYVGGACIFEFHEGNMELLRMNDRFLGELKGLVPVGTPLAEAHIIDCLDKDEREIFFACIQMAIDTRKEVSFDTRASNGVQTEYFRATVRVLAQADARYLFYCAIVNMTGQHEAVRKQVESVQQLHAIMNSINGGVIAIEINDDETASFIFANDKYYELFGYTKAQAADEHFDPMKVIAPEDVPAVMASVRKLKADKIPESIDFCCTRRDGKCGYLRATSSLMHMDGYGEVIAAVVTDITEQKQLSDRLTTIVNNISGGVSAIALREGKPEYVIVNEQYFRIVGYTRAQLEAEVDNIFDIVHPDDRDRVMRQVMAAAEDQEPFAMEYRCIRRDGTVRHILCNTNVIHLVGVDGPVQLAVSNDITELREAQRKEREAADKLRTVLKYAGNGVVVLALRDREAELLFANDAYFECIGYTREAYAQATAHDMFAPVLPEDRDRVCAALEQCNAMRENTTLEYRVRRQDGETVWLKAVITVTMLAGIDTPVQIGVFSDITAEKEAREQLCFLNDTAHEMLAQTDSKTAITKILYKLMAYFAADRGYVMELDCDRHLVRKVHEVCADGTPSAMSGVQGMTFASDEFWFAALSKNAHVVMGVADAQEEEKAALCRLRPAQDVRTVAFAPLWRAGALVGLVGVDNPSMSLSQLDRLSVLAEYIAVLIPHGELHQ